jgi:hypothetical protein
MGNGAPLPSNETQRLAEVARFCTVDSEQDEVFDKIVAMTSAYFNMPITLISIVEEHRQWFRARVGLEATQTPREVSFAPTPRWTI